MREFYVAFQHATQHSLSWFCIFVYLSKTATMTDFQTVTAGQSARIQQFQPSPWGDLAPGAAKHWIKVVRLVIAQNFVR